MIELAKGDILKAQVDAIVNPVNCVGVMGKGLAKQFEKAFPSASKAYKEACKRKELGFGKVFSAPVDPLYQPKYIIHFPTKNHWRGKSKYHEIEETLSALVEEALALGLESLAVPPLGCGNGGLDWDRVAPLVESAFEGTNLKVFLYAPTSAFLTRDQRVPDLNLKMTAVRAALLKVFEAYRAIEFPFTRLEAQKLGYFLQESGEPMRLKFAKEQFGPYSLRLHKSLETMDNVFIRGYHGHEKSEIWLVDLALSKAEQFLSKEPGDVGILTRLNSVKTLIKGWESPHGLELLSTVHWLYKRDGHRTLVELESGVGAWSERKKQKFDSYEIETACGRLRETGWCPEITGLSSDSTCDSPPTPDEQYSVDDLLALFKSGELGAAGSN